MFHVMKKITDGQHFGYVLGNDNKPLPWEGFWQIENLIYLQDRVAMLNSRPTEVTQYQSL